MLPCIERHAARKFRRFAFEQRAEAVQAVVADCARAYERLVERDRTHLASATSLAGFAVRRYRAGRRVGSRINCRDVASPVCQRRRGFAVEPLDVVDLGLVEDRRTTPANLAAVRLDFRAWLASLSPRERRVAQLLATGECTSAVARLVQLTAGRVSQLRRELDASWRQFVGEPLVATA